MSEPIDYSKTLALPVTDFPMRAGLPQKEPQILARWAEMDLYQRLREDAAGRPKYVLHDGPPYANGNLHIGHALNKILKDVITRSFQMRGYDSNYVPGWDCHGLPIEWKIEEAYRAKGQNKDDIPVAEFRKECRDFATHWVGVQSEEFLRLGVTGDFKNPYLTMNFRAEAIIAGELMKFAKSGQLYRGSKPIMWSVVEQTALAEAEIEYETVESDTVWVKFPVTNAVRIVDVTSNHYFMGEKKTNVGLTDHPYSLVQERAAVVIWTTTPWTIPGNRAISFSSRISYGLYEITGAENTFGPQAGEKLIFADKLAEEAFAKGKMTFKRLRKVEADELATITCAHPLAGYGAITSPLAGEDVGVSRQERGNLSASAKAPLSVAEDGDISPARGENKEGQSSASNDAYSFPVPLIDGDHVTDDAGTGFVHNAPGHGRDDFEVWTRNAQNLEARGISSRIPFTVGKDGYYTKEAPGFGPDAEGGAARVIDEKGKKGDANERVIKALIEAGNLFARGRIKHDYPHSWRSKKPIIYLNTPQWFVFMDKEIEGLGALSSTASNLHPEEPQSGVSKDEGSAPFNPPSFEATLRSAPQDEGLKGENKKDSATLRATALKAISETRFVPASGQNRLRAMIEQRPDWVLSRQRAWGVPISVFRHEETGQIIPGPEFGQSDTLITRIMEAFTTEGADAWYADGAKERFLDGLVNDIDKWQKINDILDVWFDSGSTHAFCLEQRPDLKWPADLYLEGSDQHRGWFHSSLLESAGTRGRAPYEAVLTHGFVMAEDGTKMSKSKGNIVTPQEVIKDSGADILRLWVMSSDYEEDLRLGKTILQTNIDSYRKIRNTIRWMLGTLAHDTGEVVAHADLPELERLMLHRLSELDQTVHAGYDAFDFKRITKALMDFCVVDLSAFYFDIRKDALYCDAPSSIRRRASLHVLREIFERLVIWLAPMLPFTAEESWLSRDPQAVSVHLEQFRQTPENWHDEKLAKRWDLIRNVRRAVTGALEIERAAKRIGSSLEAAPVIHVQMDAQSLEILKAADLSEICITSGATLTVGPGPDDAFRLPDLKHVAVEPVLAEGTKCARSWRITHDVGSDANWPDVSARDAAALNELKLLGRLAV
jgi:isoleucyl-tRNA synthetase